MGPTLCLKPSGTPVSPPMHARWAPTKDLTQWTDTIFWRVKSVLPIRGQFSVGTLGSFQVKIDSCVTTISSYVALTHGGHVLIIIIIIKDMIIYHTSCYLYWLLDGTSSHPYMIFFFFIPQKYMIFFSLLSLRSNSVVYLSMIC